MPYYAVIVWNDGGCSVESTTKKSIAWGEKEKGTTVHYTSNGQLYSGTIENVYGKKFKSLIFMFWWHMVPIYTYYPFYPWLCSFGIIR